MRARLIDASQIENKFLHWLNEISKDITNDIYQGSESDGIAACLEEIREAPTVDLESLRPRAHWITVYGTDGSVWSKCPICQNELDGLEDGFSFCPHCGAKMEILKDE